MLISEITAKLEERQSVYEVFQRPELQQVWIWLEKLTLLPADLDVPFELLPDADILSALDLQAQLFEIAPEAGETEEEDYIPEIIEGFQIIEPEENDLVVVLTEKTEMLENIVAGLEEANEGLREMVEILTNQLSNPVLESTKEPSEPIPQPKLFGEPEPLEDADEFAEFDDLDFNQGTNTAVPDLAAEPAPIATENPKKKLSQLTVLKIIGATTACIVVIAILLPHGKKGPAKPANALAAQPAVIPAAPPVQKPVSSARQQPVQQASPQAAVQPPTPKVAEVPHTPEPTKEEPHKEPKHKKAAVKEEPTLAKRQITFAEEGASVQFAPNKVTRIYLPEGEDLTGIEGEDTTNWTVGHSKGQRYITISPRKQEGNNTIVLTTNKHTYMLKATIDTGASNSAMQIK